MSICTARHEPSWLRAIEFVRDYRDIGDGHGGWREDHAYYCHSVAM